MVRVSANFRLTACSEADYYKESAKTMEKFQETLKSLTLNLQNKKVFETLGVPPREPTMCDLTFYLSLTATISDRGESCKAVSTCKKFIRSTFKRTGVLANIIEMFPTDIYGSLICGGFTLILDSCRTQRPPPRKP